MCIRDRCILAPSAVLGSLFSGESLYKHQGVFVFSKSIVASLFFLASSVVFAQTDRGTITGTVSDPASAVIPGAQVQARNVDTGAVYNAASSNTGNYSLTQLPAGSYEMTVSNPGFKTFVRQNLTVQVASTIRIDVNLEVGTTSESVTVSDAATLLK